MTIYFDMDGVLADWVSGFNDKFENIISYEEFSNSDADVRDHYRILIDSDPNFYQSLKVNHRMVNIIRVLLERGHDVQILTSVGDSHSNLIASQKVDWIRKHVDESIKVNIVTTSKDKSLYVESDSDILVDDRDKALEPFRAAGGQVVKYVIGDSIDRVENLFYI